MTELRSWLQSASAQLAPISDNASLDAQVLLAHFLQKPRSWILAHDEIQIDENLETALNEALSQLHNGMPLPYIIGHWEFYALDFLVTPDVLIPRPETELLVEKALDWLDAHPQRRRATDIGTGSGCIAVSLAKHTPNLSITAVDISPAALTIAAQNAAANGVQSKINFVRGNLTQALQSQFDLICSNPPYIPSYKLPGLAVTKHEPSLALDGGPEGLDAIRILLADVPRLLAPGGLMLIEIESGQREAVLDLAHELLPQYHACVLPDLAGLPRLLYVESIPS
jgi:release factor glutamine methyltransferase